MLYNVFNEIQEEEIEVTVCIAAICESGKGVIGASDRLKTSGDITFESSQKFFGITKSIAIMTSGNANFQNEILLTLEQKIKKEESKSNWLVKDVVDKYIECRNQIILEKLNNTVFATWGLDYKTFLRTQNSFSTQVLESIMEEKYSFERKIPAISVIITGIDQYGTQLYVINNGESMCFNHIGFAAIGSGARQANTQLMLAKYTPYFSFSDALLLIHNSKKRSEISPGVGCSTDMFLIESQDSSYALKSEIVDKLDKLYASAIKKENKIQLAAREETDKLCIHQFLLLR